MIDERRFRYLGHCARYPNNRWVKIMLTGGVSGYADCKKTPALSLQKQYLQDLKRLDASWDHCADRDIWRMRIDNYLACESRKEEKVVVIPDSVSRRDRKSVV